MIVATYFIDKVMVDAQKNKVQEYFNKHIREFEYRAIQDDKELIEFENTLKELVKEANELNHRVKAISYNKCGFILGGHVYFFEAGQVPISSIRVITIRGDWKGGMK